MKPIFPPRVLIAGCLVAVASAQISGVVHAGRMLVGERLPPTLLSACFVQLPSAPLVAGADSCVAPDVILGAGPFAYDTTLATTGVEGQSESSCNFSATTGITNDVWFTWTASITGTVDVSMCGQGNMDSKLAVYAGTTCPAAGTALACDDEFCGFGSVSQVTLNVTAGSSYVIQIGNFPSAFGGIGAFTIAPPSGVPSNDDCSVPTVLSGPGTYAFDNTAATTGAQQPNSCQAVQDDSWFQYAATRTGTATATTCGLSTSPDTDTVMAVYAGAGCPTSTALACADDSCGLESAIVWPTTCGNTYVLQVGAYFASYHIAGSLSVSESGPSCGPAGTTFCSGDGSGTPCPCGNNGTAGNGCANSVDTSGANLTTSGMSSLTNDTLVLRGSGMPDSSCLYFQGTSQLSIAYGDGLRCAGGVVVRLSTKTNVAGSSRFPTAGDRSISAKGGVIAPGTRTYQTWYRNAATFCTSATFNLTNGLSVVWDL